MLVSEAVDGRAALSRLEPETDVVVLDVILPDSSGFEICQKIKSEFDPFLPVLLISAESVATADRVVGLEKGADAYLSLPVEARELIATVNSLGRLRRAERSRTFQAEVAVLTAETAVAMMGDLDLPGVLQHYTQEIVSRLGVAAAAVWLNDDGVLRLSASAGLAVPADRRIAAEFRLPPGLRNGLRQMTTNRLTAQNLDIRQLADSQWLERNRLSSAEGYVFPGNDGVAGLAALFATNPMPHEILDLLAASADSVALGVERKRNKSDLVQSEQASERDAIRIHQLERELARLEELAMVTVPVASQAFGTQPIGETHPAEFNGAVEEFQRWLLFALEERSLKIDRGIPEGLRKLADRLTQLRVGPRDVIEIYTAALKQATESTTGRKDHACVEEGRLLVLELMGNLVSNYRALSLASAPGRNRTHRLDLGEEVKRDG
jgi:CheY-like chemotaxis protein